MMLNLRTNKLKIIKNKATNSDMDDTRHSTKKQTNVIDNSVSLSMISLNNHVFVFLLYHFHRYQSPVAIGYCPDLPAATTMKFCPL